MKQKIDIQAELRAYIARHYKTQRAAADAWAVTPAFVSHVLLGKSAPTERMLSDAGFRREITPASVSYVKAK